MSIPLEISYKNTPRDEYIDSLIHEKARDLESYQNRFNRCLVSVELEQGNEQVTETTRAYHVRIRMQIPDKKEVVVKEKSNIVRSLIGLKAIIRKAFTVAEKQLTKMEEKQEKGPGQFSGKRVRGKVSVLFHQDNFGFIEYIQDGSEIYFDRNSVAAGEYDNLSVGTDVSFTIHPGKKGMQAANIKII